jgi:trimeric autotransporter adhesin
MRQSAISLEMRRSSLKPARLSICLAILSVCAGSAHAQPAMAQASDNLKRSTSTVPQLIKFAGTLRDRSGAVLDGVYGVTFSIYRDEAGGAPLWMETQNVQAAAGGAYSVMLGATKELPVELFRTGEPRWLSSWIQLPGEQERARTQLVSVPFALKAADAETLGGQPLSAFVQRSDLGTAAAATARGSTGGSSGTVVNSVIRAAGTTGGTPGTLSMFDTDGVSLVNSVARQASGNIGIGIANPASPLHVNAITVDTVGQLRLTSPGSWPLIMNQDGGSTFTLNNGGRDVFTITGGGNVGIGTTQPTTALSVLGNVRSGLNQTNYVGDAFTGAGGFRHALFGTTYFDGVSSNFITPGVGSNAVAVVAVDTNGVAFYTAPVTGTFSRSDSLGTFSAYEQMRVTSSGNVGIGTARATPGSQLEVNGSIKSTLHSGGGITFQDGTVQTTAAGALSFSADHAEALKSQGEAVKKLESQNAALQQQIADLRAELESLRLLMQGRQPKQ